MGILQSYHISVNDLKGCDLAVFNLTIVGSIFCLQYSLIEPGIVFPGKRAMLNQSSVSFIFLMGICLEARIVVPTYDTISKKGYGGVAQKNFWAMPFLDNFITFWDKSRRLCFENVGVSLFPLWVRHWPWIFKRLSTSFCFPVLCYINEYGRLIINFDPLDEFVNNLWNVE